MTPLVYDITPFNANHIRTLTLFEGPNDADGLQPTPATKVAKRPAASSGWSRGARGRIFLSDYQNRITECRASNVITVTTADVMIGRKFL